MPGWRGTYGAGRSSLRNEARPDWLRYLQPQPRALYRHAHAWAKLCPLVGDFDTTSLCAIPRDTPALRLLTHYVTGVATDAGLLGRETARAFATHIHDLVALAIGPTPSGSMIAESRGLRAARLHQIKYDIRARLRNCELNIVSVAARHGITPRYVHKLFEGEGVTFAEYLRSERLAGLSYAD